MNIYFNQIHLADSEWWITVAINKWISYF